MRQMREAGVRSQAGRKGPVSGRWPGGLLVLGLGEIAGRFRVRAVARVVWSWAS